MAKCLLVSPIDTSPIDYSIYSDVPNEDANKKYKKKQKQKKKNKTKNIDSAYVECSEFSGTYVPTVQVNRFFPFPCTYSTKHE